MNESTKNMSDLGSMKALKTGECVSFEIRKLATIRTNATNINTTRGKKSLTTKLDREKGTITVTRIA